MCSRPHSLSTEPSPHRAQVNTIFTYAKWKRIIPQTQGRITLNFNDILKDQQFATTVVILNWFTIFLPVLKGSIKTSAESQSLLTTSTPSTRFRFTAMDCFPRASVSWDMAFTYNINVLCYRLLLTFSLRKWFNFDSFIKLLRKYCSFTWSRMFIATRVTIDWLNHGPHWY